MARKGIIWFVLIAAVMSGFLGCDGDDDSKKISKNQAVSGKYDFQIREWRSISGQWIKGVPPGNIQNVQNGTQFDLLVINNTTGEVTVFPASRLYYVSFYKNGVPFQPRVIGLTPADGVFYRIDEQSLSDLYSVTGMVLIDNTWYNLCRQFRVLCPDLMPPY